MLNGRPPRALSGSLALGLAVNLCVGSGAAAADPATARAKYLWSQSPYGKLLERILPPVIEPRELPEPYSEGAQVMSRYCVQCHYLPSPQMHAADKWKVVVARMVWRMKGKGNLGALMKEMMDRVEAPGDGEIRALTAYLGKHGQRAMDPTHPALKSEAGQMYAIACTQCHGLPDPERHTAREWPLVVERMKGHMAWANTVVGEPSLRTTPVLDTAQIVRFLQRHARPDSKTP